MTRRHLLFFLFVIVVVAAISVPSPEAKSADPYKALGVDRNASQREIQKAFHKLSLQYHPDKNKKKDAQEKFAEINNAYEILSDEEKRKNYDLYGDEKGQSGFGGENAGNREGYNYFTHDAPGSSFFSSGPGGGGWQAGGGDQGNARSFSFSFGGGAGNSGNPFDFSFADMFSNAFGGGMKSGKRNGETGSSSGSRFNSPLGSIEAINSNIFNKKIRDQGLTWLLLIYAPSATGYHILESAVTDVAGSLSGAVKAGSINCLKEHGLCKDLGVSISKSAKVFVYSYSTSVKGSPVEYKGDSDARSLKKFTQDHLPGLSKRIELDQFRLSSVSSTNLPIVLLLSTKKDTPAMWRALSGLHYKRFEFYYAEVHDLSHPKLKQVGVVALPAVVGRLSDGSETVLKAGISVKDLQSGISELTSLLEDFEKRNSKVASGQARKSSKMGPKDGGIPRLTGSNIDSLCGEKTSVCIIGVFRSSKAEEKLESILSAISQKTLVRRPSEAADSVSYSMLDATKHHAFLKAFDRSGFKSANEVVVAYKPRRGKFAVLSVSGGPSMEEVERFVGSVLCGDVRFANTLQKKPALR